MNRRLLYKQLNHQRSLAPSAFDRHAQIAEVAAKASITCSDADDQKLIDLAVARQALLLGRDQPVL